MLSKWIRERYDRCVLEGTVSSVNRSMLIEISQAEINQIAALESENARLRAMVEWKPIEEAPRDRTAILLLLKNKLIVQGYCWHDQRGEERWSECRGPDIDRDEITHFRLLPPLPEI